AEKESVNIGTLAEGNQVAFYHFISIAISKELEFWKVGKSAFGDGETGQRVALETMKLIIEAYPHLIIADIKLVFKSAKLGEYGPVYDRLDGATILEWFKNYDHKRHETEIWLQ